MKKRKRSKKIPEVRKIYRILESSFGDLGWWPGETAFEVVVGAILTQNTAWSNVEKAIEALKKNGLLNIAAIKKERPSRLARIIRPSGYHRMKAARLKYVCRFLSKECGGKLARLKKQETGALRKKLLEVNGIGPETADSILLYALEKPVFVVDAYTKRIFSRHGLICENASYDEVQSFVSERFDKDVRALNQFHALLVEVGKRFCKKKRGLCGECPLGVLLER